MKRKSLLSFALVGMCLICFSLVGCSSGANTTSSSTTRMVKNSEGVEVEIPSEITKAVPVIGAFAQMTEIVAGPGKIVAAATANVTDYFKKVFPDYAVSNPNNYDASSVEGVIASGAQVVYGPDSSYSDEQKTQLEQAGISFVAINNMKTVDDMCDSFLIIGDIFGAAGKTRAQNFVNYYQGNIETAKKMTATIAAENKVTILDLRYSGGAYSTINGTDICNEYFEAAGGINVAKDYNGTGSGTGLTVNAEQVVAWNPQVIMAFNQPAKEAILNDPTLADVQAVKTGKVYVCPQGVYNWSVRSGEGAMLPLWLGTVMYPDLFANVDMSKNISDFFSNYYSYKISADEIVKVLAGSEK
ncbi:ABC transporter substrate-binding protein [Acetobacterium paludosum]|uniref:ABC transporter substrate-binding protein n=1 Tax=Acetobacterium paludosum TaxID=52693 RepID=A0A923KRZ4_9FIRM|nr:ABC transporter substrate-binding protein [Acetobacterium paludosum]MBC3887812.1 ABC transporter substrate-binding protein [Acetobacterium paludosum]